MDAVHKDNLAGLRAFSQTFITKTCEMGLHMENILKKDLWNCLVFGLLFNNYVVFVCCWKDDINEKGLVLSKKKEKVLTLV